MKYRIIVPAVFLLLMFFFFVFFVGGAGGHGSNPFDFVIYLLFPICFLTGPLLKLGGPPIISFAVCILASGVQYFIIGFGIDKLLARRQRLKATKEI